MLCEYENGNEILAEVENYREKLKAEWALPVPAEMWQLRAWGKIAALEINATAIERLSGCLSDNARVLIPEEFKNLPISTVRFTLDDVELDFSENGTYHAINLNLASGKMGYAGQFTKNERYHLNNRPDEFENLLYLKSNHAAVVKNASQILTECFSLENEAKKWTLYNTW